jgi:hypothetical protein
LISLFVAGRRQQWFEQGVNLWRLLSNHSFPLYLPKVRSEDRPASYLHSI